MIIKEVFGYVSFEKFLHNNSEHFLVVYAIFFMNFKRVVSAQSFQTNFFDFFLLGHKSELNSWVERKILLQIDISNFIKEMEVLENSNYFGCSKDEQASILWKLY